MYGWCWDLVKDIGMYVKDMDAVGVVIERLTRLECDYDPSSFNCK